jgi:predicted MPP superfamily phosphohydrolase
MEPTWLQFTQHECLIPDLARSLDQVHLSDFHASSDVSQSLIERANESAIGARADFICVTGDFVTTASGFDAGWYVAALRRLAVQAPTFCGSGQPPWRHLVVIGRRLPHHSRGLPHRA